MGVLWKEIVGLVIGKGDEDMDQPMISPAAAHFLGVVLSKKKEGKNTLHFFHLLLSYL